MKNILVTGGAGFIGSHTVVELISNGFNPIIVDNFSNSERFVLKNIKQLTNYTNLRLYETDCTVFSDMDKIFEEEEIHGVIHFAAFKAVGESVLHALKYHKNNVNSMNVILECMKKHQVDDLVFSSSCTVYGDPEGSQVSEESPKNPPTSPYGRTKVYCEAAITDVHAEKDSSLNTVMLRYFNPIGAHESGLLGELPLGPPNNLVPYITQTAAGIREKLIIFGSDYDTPDGTCVRDYIHVVDVAKAHVSALQWLQNEKYSLEAVNLGSGKGDSVLSVVNTFEKVSGLELNYEIGERRVGDVSALCADPSKAKRLFDWETTHSLEDALRDAWRWQEGLKTLK